jgi:molybdopterin molybdotransferase
MIDLEAAREEVRRRSAPPGRGEEIPLGDALGRALSEPLRADRDDPPFDRALMDGYAVRSEDLPDAPRTLRVTGEVSAGDAALPAVAPGCAVRINTGAPIPPGADAVARIEETRGSVEVLRAIARGADVLPRGALARKGDLVVEGTITPEKLAVLASIGAHRVKVAPRLRVAVLATGSELEEDPSAHAIRNSNGPMLCALLAGHDVVDLGVARDEPRELAAALRRGLECDALVTTGGVSKGLKDLVRGSLESLGVRVVFHGVALQPGKPTLFGEHPKGFVFSLPGNPVAALVCCDLFVLPHLSARSGLSFEGALARLEGRLVAPVRGSPDRTRLLPALLRRGELRPLPWRGSADLYTASRGNSYVILPPDGDFAAGDAVSCLVPARHLLSVWA